MRLVIIARTKAVMVVFDILKVSSLCHNEASLEFIFFVFLLALHLASTVHVLDHFVRVPRLCKYTRVWIFNYLRQHIRLIDMIGVSCTTLFLLLANIPLLVLSWSWLLLLSKSIFRCEKDTSVKLSIKRCICLGLFLVISLFISSSRSITL